MSDERAQAEYDETRRRVIEGRASTGEATLFLELLKEGGHMWAKEKSSREAAEAERDKAWRVRNELGAEGGRAVERALAAEAEVERLREALRKIVARVGDTRPYSQMTLDMWTIARAALSPREDA